MRIFSKKRPREFWENDPPAEEPLMFWYRVTKKAQWKNLNETRKDFPHADQVEYARQEVYIKYILTHAEYDEEKWKSSCRSKKT